MLRLPTVLALSLILSSGAALAQQTQQPPEPPPPAAAQPPAPEVPPVPAPPPPAPDHGDFKVVYEKVKDPDNRELQEIFRHTQLLEETTRALNEKLSLPVDVTVSLRECGAADATYEADKHRISICYELVGAFAELFLRASGKAPDAAQVGAAVASATLFALFHETGHALIDLYALPAANKEEAADQLATLILVGSGREGGLTAVDSASTLLKQERNDDVRAKLAHVPFWSGHGFDEARLAGILCWVYGRDPQAFQELVGDGTLPAARAEGCPAESRKVAKVWAEPLTPFLKGWTPVPPPPAPPSEPPSPPPPSSPPPPTS